MIEMQPRHLQVGERMFVIPWSIYIARETGQAWIAGDAPGVTHGPCGTASAGLERTPQGLVAYLSAEDRERVCIEDATNLAWRQQTRPLLPLVRIVTPGPPPVAQDLERPPAYHRAWSCPALRGRR